MVVSSGGGGNGWVRPARPPARQRPARSEEHTSELQSLMSNSYAGFCLNKNNHLVLLVLLQMIKLTTLSIKPKLYHLCLCPLQQQSIKSATFTNLNDSIFDNLVL